MRDLEGRSDFGSDLGIVLPGLNRDFHLLGYDVSCSIALKWAVLDNHIGFIVDEYETTM